MEPELIEIDGHEFAVSGVTAGHTESDGPIILKKDTWMLDRYAELAEELRGGTVVEVGLWDGGSTAYLASAFQPRSLVGIELAKRPLHALDRFLTDSPLHDRVHVATGVDQSDTTTIAALLQEHTDGPLDLVVDDASHVVGPTTTTFEFLFPRVRPGGVYIIEDWSSEHQVAEAIRAGMEAGTLADEYVAKLAGGVMPTNPLSLLVLDLVMLVGSGNGMIEDVSLRPAWAEIRRGPTPIDPDNFKLRELVGNLGRGIVPSPPD